MKVTQDPKYVSIFYTFDKHTEVSCEGTRMDTPVANATKARMLEASLPGTLSIKSCQGKPNDYVEEINAFCEEGTGGKIPEIVTELDGDCVAVLLCCVFLKVKWEVEGKRQPIAEFYPHPGSMGATRPTPLLTQQRYFGYKDMHLGTWTDSENGVTWLKLDCKPDEQTGDQRFMLYALPSEEDDDYKWSLLASMKLLSTDKFVSVKFDKVRLPCVSVATNKLDGKALLEHLGVLDIFYDKDSLPMMFWSPASDSGVIVSRIIHASCIEWNDKGAQAAAATLVEFTYRSLGATGLENKFIMNRPGLALLCKAIPTEETHHLGNDCSRAKPRAGLLCEFFTLVEGHESADTPGSMGDFAKDDASVGVSEEVFAAVDPCYRFMHNRLYNEDGAAYTDC